MSVLEQLRATGRLPGRRARRVPGSVALSLAVIALTAGLVALGPLLAPGATSQDLSTGVVPAGSPGHLLGTDSLGRDVLAMSVAGARSALVGPVLIALGSMTVGTVVGTAAAYRGGLPDAVVSRACEVLLSLPTTLLAIVVAGTAGGGYWLTVLVLLILFTPSDTRMVRAATLQQLPQPYIESTQVLGLPAHVVLARHVLPNITGIIRANLLVNVAFAIVSMAGLSYLGLGVRAGAADWGRQLADGRELLYTNPAASVVPGLLIVLVATAVSIVGDWWGERGETQEERHQ